MHGVAESEPVSVTSGSWEERIEMTTLTPYQFTRAARHAEMRRCFVSLATGSSWTTAGTVGVALIGIILIVRGRRK